MRLMTAAPVGRAVRATLIRPGSVWRIPWGIGQGLLLEVDPNAPLHIYLGTVELELVQHLRRFAQPGTTVFDVGGHDAYYAMVFARLTGAKVTSFEFCNEAVARMRRNLALNIELTARVKIVQTYLAAESNHAPRTDSLDSLVRIEGMVGPDLMMIDVEGAEAVVLRGAREILHNRRPNVIVETHSRALEAECVEILRDADYLIVIVDQRGWLREKRGTGHNRWLIADRNA
jgi:hypothetical protein